jgi:hypothetical protein
MSEVRDKAHYEREARESWEAWEKAIERMAQNEPKMPNLSSARLIAEQLSSLSRDARKAGLDTVAYLIEMAREEAERGDQFRSPPSSA